MSDANFASILDKPASEVERPKPFPQGTYVFAVMGLPRIDKSTKKQTEYSEYTCRPIQALDDVDADALAEFGGLTEKTMKHTLYHTEASAFMLKEFFTALGIEGLDDGKKSLRTAMSEVAGRQFLGHVTHEASNDGTRVFAKIDKVAAVG